MDGGGGDIVNKIGIYSSNTTFVLCVYFYMFRCLFLQPSSGRNKGRRQAPFALQTVGYKLFLNLLIFQIVTNNNKIQSNL